MKKLFSYIFLIISVFLLSSCGKDLTKGTLEDYTYQEVDEVTNYVKLVTGNDEVVLIELYPDIAPLTVENFQKLVSEKFYDNLIFHRVVADFAIQTGSPEGNSYTSGGTPIKGEFASNGITNDLKHGKGILSMARSNDKDSASSQFFICVSDNASVQNLDGNYAAFGKVIAGYDVIQKISEVDVDNNDKPIYDQRIKSMRFVEVK